MWIFKLLLLHYSSTFQYCNVSICKFYVKDSIEYFSDFQMTHVKETETKMELVIPKKNAETKVELKLGHALKDMELAALVILIQKILLKVFLTKKYFQLLWDVVNNLMKIALISSLHLPLLQELAVSKFANAIQTFAKYLKKVSLN